MGARRRALADCLPVRDRVLSLVSLYFALKTRVQLSASHVCFFV